MDSEMDGVGGGDCQRCKHAATEDALDLMGAWEEEDL